VPTEEARITLQMLYSAVPPTAIASARVAMLPPVDAEPGRKAKCRYLSCVAAI
jgi:hypothetical protein